MRLWPGDLQVTLDQLDFLRSFGVREDLLSSAEDALLTGAGREGQLISIEPRPTQSAQPEGKALGPPPPEPPDRHAIRVFLCHAAEDKPAVRELHAALRQSGFSPWLDEEELLPGQDWDLEIRRAVRACDVVVVCLSTRSLGKRGYVQKEITRALDVADERPPGEIYLIPARLEECDVPERLAKWHWVDLWREQGYRRLEISLGLAADHLEKLP